MMPLLRIISWNTAHRKNCAAKQVEALLSRSPDLVTLQEVPCGMEDVFRRLLTAGGLKHAAFSNPPANPVSRSYGVLIASCFPIDVLQSLSIPWPEKVLSVVVSTEDHAVELHSAHVPNGSGNRWIKIETLEGLYAGLAKPSKAPRILTGDFNAPQLELPTGELVTWAQKVMPDGTVRTRHQFRGGSGIRWDEGERRVLSGLAEFGFRDAFRLLYGYGVSEYSWAMQRKDKSIKRRFDHVLASIKPLECNYLHEWREAKLSDHSPIETVFDTNAELPSAF